MELYIFRVRGVVGGVEEVRYYEGSSFREVERVAGVEMRVLGLRVVGVGEVPEGVEVRGGVDG